MLAAFLAVNMSIEIFVPGSAYALTGGPSQPEVQSFEPIGTSEMVNLFSGDFTYNIPLIDVGGYPVNISYNSNITMDQEASWVGLGWNINPGVINRNKRGLPDDFNGTETITTTTHMKKQVNAGVNGSFNTEVFGKKTDGLVPSLSASYGIQYNNYTGVSVTNSIGAKFAPFKNENIKLGLRLNSGEDGLNLTPEVSYSKNVKDKNSEQTKLTGSVGATFNARQGLKSYGVGYSASSKNYGKTRKNGKHHSNSSGANGGSQISLAASTYTPQISTSMKGNTISGSWSMGIEAWGADAQVSVSGWYSENKLLNDSEEKSAFGYLYSHIGNANPHALHDYNREKDGAFNPEYSTSLPLTNYTYDIYSAVGQGIGGMFRPKRGQVGYVYDTEATNNSNSESFGIETSGSAIAKWGGNLGMDISNNTSGKWNNIAESELSFNASDHSTHENFYFKQAGEKTPVDQNYFDAFRGWDAVRIGLSDPIGMNVKGKATYANGHGGEWNITDNSQDEREHRNMVISYITKDERSDYATDPDRTVYDEGGSSTTGHHVGEFVAYKDDGSRYVYGLPVYNTVEREVTFNISGGSNKDCATGLIGYNSTDASTSNDNGRDNFYQKIETPPYAYAYLLTEVLSSDYVDYDNINGPSDGDLGNYTQIHYKDITSSSQYKWRVPVTENRVSYSEGIKSDPDDDKGSYVYGEKEIYYVDSIVTKTHIAIFHTSAREDGFEVKSETGGINSSTGLSMHKLDSISLYSKPDFRDNGYSAEPIKRVHFEYDYSLCGASVSPLPNNSGDVVYDADMTNINTNKGKLTLKKLYFTYGNSYKAKLSPYEFSYADLDHDGTQDANPAYNLKGYDRWGNYKPNSSGSCVPGGTITAPEFPYAEQDQTNADTYTASWSLTSILLPSGGKIEVDYESDDYAYVQNRLAMRMFKVVGMANSTPNISSPNWGSKLYDKGTNNKYEYIVFELANSELKTDYSKTDFKKEYLYDIINKYDNRLYFKYLIDLTGKGNWDYVPGYAKVVDYDVMGSGSSYTHGWIKVDAVPRYSGSSPDRNPMMKTAWNFAKAYIPDIAFESKVKNLNGNPLQFARKALFPIIDDVVELFKGTNQVFEDKGYAHNFIPSKSWIRLAEPDGYKLGGGSRVKTIKIYDMWDSMTSSETGYDYGQEYTYEIYDGNFGKTVSSGVASYEPLVGGDENPFRQPVFTNETKLLAPDQEHYVEEPFGESFFPGPSVGYRRVDVKNLERLSGAQKVRRHATGKVVNEFYTTKDFPTVVKRTGVDIKPAKSNLLGRIFKFNYKDYLTASQGFTIILNDMNGKQKSQFVYAENQAQPISGVRYHYNSNKFVTNNYENNTVSLNNEVTTIDKDGSVTQELLGVEFDVINDFREFESKNRSMSVDGNADLFLVGPFPALVPTIWPSYKNMNTRFRSASTTKVINQYGILTKTEAFDLGSRVVTENMAWDHETGEVLMTATRNDFEDTLYTTTYPAHWAYERMGSAYENIREVGTYKIDNTNGNLLTTGGTATAPSYLYQGDEVKMINQTTTGAAYDLDHGWLWDDDDTDNKIYVIKSDGTLFTGISGDEYEMTVMRSGKRNMGKTPVSSVTALRNPLEDTNSDGDYDTFIYADQTTYNPNDWEVINSSAVEFAEEWGNYYCDKFNVDCGCTQNCTTAGGVIDALTTTPRAFDLCTLDVNGQATTNTHADCDLVGWGCYVDITINSPNPGKYAGTVIGNDGTTERVFQNIQPVPCTQYTFTGKIKVKDYGFVSCTMVAQKAGGYGSCKIYNCDSATTSPPDLVVNPYIEGIRGNFRPWRSYLYLGERTQRTSGTDNNLNIREDGQYVDFNPFWDVNAGNDWTKDITDWTYTSEVTAYNPYGAEIENRDALNRYSAAVYAYTEHLPVAVASNANFRNIAFDGFEDYDFAVNSNCSAHFGFRDDKAKLTTNESHTGDHSMEIDHATSITSDYPITSYFLGGADDVPYTLKINDNIGIFSPITTSGDLTLVVSYWVKEVYDPSYEQQINDPLYNNLDNYGSHTVNVKYTDLSSTTTTLTASNEVRSPIIDGWQKVQFEVTVSALSQGDITVELKAGNKKDAFYDDIRIQPYNSSMKTFVYDPVSLRLVAELDENNYATMYEYDEEGALTRIKKETENGIKTIQESRNSQYKKIP